MCVTPLGHCLGEQQSAQPPMDSTDKLGGVHLHVSVYISTGPLQLPLRLEPWKRPGGLPA